MSGGRLLSLSVVNFGAPNPWFIVISVAMDLGLVSSPVRQKVRDACHGGTLGIN